MKPKDRQRRIADLVADRGEASVDDLSHAFAVSPETIRRDLTHLAEAGAVLKVHGAARRIRSVAEASFAERVADGAGAKAEIARKLVPLIHAGDTILMDTGSTTLAAAAALSAVSGLTVVTNSVRIAQVMSAANVLLLGGRYRPDNAQTVGSETVARIAEFRADVAILSATAIDPDAGAMDADLEEAQIARAMRSHARRCIILAHGAKLGKTAMHRICSLREMDVLVCDGVPEPSLAATLTGAGVMLC